MIRSHKCVFCWSGLAHVTAVLISDISTNCSAISDLQQHNNLSNHLTTVNKYISYYNTRASVCLSVQTITRAFVQLGASDSTRALLGVAGRSSSLSLAVCGRAAKIRSLLRRHALVWAAILCAHAPRCNCDDLYPTGHVRRTGSY